MVKATVRYAHSILQHRAGTAPGTSNENVVLLCRAVVAQDEILGKLREISAAMAEDDGLWFVAQTASEAYLQQELRKLCALIELAEGSFQKAERTFRQPEQNVPTDGAAFNSTKVRTK